MESAKEVVSAALKIAATLLLAAVFLSGLALSDPTNTNTKKVKHSADPSLAKRLRTKSSRGSLTASKRGHKTEEASGGSARARTRRVMVTRKKVNGRWVRVTRVVSTPQAPSFQTHPDPERYQQIQQALASAGYYKGEVNGQWNDDSVDALKRFQTDRQIPNDGKISSLSLIGLGLGPNRQRADVSAPAAAAPSSN